TATTEIYTLSLHDALPISELISGHAWLARGVGQEVDLAQRMHHPSRPRGTAGRGHRRGALSRPLPHRPPAEFAGHLHLLVREAVPLARLNPGPDLRRKRLL